LGKAMTIEGSNKCIGGSKKKKNLYKKSHGLYLIPARVLITPCSRNGRGSPKKGGEGGQNRKKRKK